MKNPLLLSVAASVALLASAANASAHPFPDGQVLDQASELSALSELKLNAKLKELEDKTALNMVVMTVPTLAGTTPEAFADDMLDRWAKTAPNAKHRALFLLAPKDRTFTVQVRVFMKDSAWEGRPDAYWFEQGVAPPSFVNQLEAITADAVVPHFKKGDWEAGFVAAIDAIVAAIPIDETSEADESQTVGA